MGSGQNILTSAGDQCNHWDHGCKNYFNPGQGVTSLDSAGSVISSLDSDVSVIRSLDSEGQGVSSLDPMVKR